MRMQNYDCYAITPPGVEEITARELAALGTIPDGTEPGGVSFPSDAGGIARANLELRTASRLLVRVATFHASAFHELERRANRLAWEAYVPPGRSVAFRVTSRKSKLYHQSAIAQRLGESVMRRVPGATVSAGDMDLCDRAIAESGPQLFVVRLFHDECTVSADSSGEHLHHRGYRLAGAKAPLRETLAAAMLLATAWDGTIPLIDPLCGSGTIPIEAALLARRIPPGLRRAFACEQWPDFPRSMFASARTAAQEHILARTPAPILGSDRDAGAIDAASENATRAGVPESVQFRKQAISALEPFPGPGLVATNPPYGIRVGRSRDLRDLYAQLGNVLRRRCSGWRVALLSGRDELARQTRLPLAPAFRTSNGGLRVKLLVATIPPAA